MKNTNNGVLAVFSFCCLVILFIIATISESMGLYQVHVLNETPTPVVEMIGNDITVEMPNAVITGSADIAY